MTSIEMHCASTSHEDPPSTGERGKSVLFCPTCGFECALGDGWLVREAADGHQYICPNCKTTVASR